MTVRGPKLTHALARAVHDDMVAMLRLSRAAGSVPVMHDEGGRRLTGEEVDEVLRQLDAPRPHTSAVLGPAKDARPATSATARERLRAAARVIARIGGGLHGWRVWKPWRTARLARERRREWSRAGGDRVGRLHRRRHPAL